MNHPRLGNKLSKALDDSPNLKNRVHLYRLATQRIYSLVVGNDEAKHSELSDNQYNQISEIEGLAASYITDDNVPPVEAVEQAYQTVMHSKLYFKFI